MVEEQSKKLDDAMTKIINDMDKTFLRKFQGDMHRCAAKCCDNTTSSMQEVHSCVERCSTLLKDVEHYVQNEFGTVQTRLQRCVLDCNDTIKDRIGASPSDSEMQRHNADFEKCAIKCVDKHVEILPAMLKRMKEVLRQKESQHMSVG